MKTSTDAKEWLVLMEYAFWSIKNEQGNTVGRHREPEGEDQKAKQKTDLEASAQHFLRVASLLPAGRYTLEAWKSLNGQSAKIVYDFYNGNEAPAVGKSEASEELQELRQMVRDLQNDKAKREKEAYEKALEEKYAKKYATKQVDPLEKFSAIVAGLTTLANLGNKAPAPAVGKPEAHEATEEETISESLEALNEKLGTEGLTQALEKLAKLPPEQLKTFSNLIPS